jgi:hypothetical protein
MYIACTYICTHDVHTYVHAMCMYICMCMQCACTYIQMRICMYMYTSEVDIWRENTFLLIDSINMEGEYFFGYGFPLQKMEVIL